MGHAARGDLRTCTERVGAFRSALAGIAGSLSNGGHLCRKDWRELDEDGRWHPHMPPRMRRRKKTIDEA
jgi:hypothetical protein